VLRAGAEEAILCEDFHVGWPDAPHRVLRGAIESAQRGGSDVVGHVDLHGRRLDVPRWSVLAPTRGTTGAVDAMALYAGQSVGAVREVCPAGDVVRELADGAERLLAEAAQSMSALKSA
jgi:hypothetical protein